MEYGSPHSNFQDSIGEPGLVPGIISMYFLSLFRLHLSTHLDVV